MFSRGTDEISSKQARREEKKEGRKQFSTSVRKRATLLEFDKIKLREVKINVPDWHVL